MVSLSLSYWHLQEKTDMQAEVRGGVSFKNQSFIIVRVISF